MTTQEIKLFEDLGRWWNRFLELPPLCAPNAGEALKEKACNAIHDLQTILASREGLRHYEQHCLHNGGAAPEDYGVIEKSIWDKLPEPPKTNARDDFNT
jgi:hypothetical protein